ncbi:MAG: hypothetical protein WD894_07520 [Pirellulales bacterium]
MKSAVFSLSIMLLIGANSFGQMPQTAPPRSEPEMRFAAQQPLSQADAPPPRLPELRPESAPEPISPEPLTAPQGEPIARPLTLADLERIALANNPTLTQLFARVQAARGAWLQAGLYPNPKVAYQGSEIGNENTAGLQGGFVEQEIVTHGQAGTCQGSGKSSGRAASTGL